MIEAMALGLPIVANDIGPVREIVDPVGNADLVDASNPASLAEAISDVLLDDQRRIAMARCSLRSSPTGSVSIDPWSRRSSSTLAPVIRPA